MLNYTNFNKTPYVKRTVMFYLISGGFSIKKLLHNAAQLCEMYVSDLILSKYRVWMVSILWCRAKLQCLEQAAQHVA